MTDKQLLPTLFSSHEQFRRNFMHGLSRLLDKGGMNLFILVCANASFEPQLFSALKQRLAQEYDRLLNDLQTRLGNGAQIREADDDLLVFLKLAAIGFEHLQLTERRSAGLWEIQFNHVRSFRPMRNSQRYVESIHMEFDNDAFNFNKSFMQQEQVWSGSLLGTPIDLYYNKYPFVESHCLLVPRRQARMPQYLTKEVHEFTWRLLDLLKIRLPGVRVGYNSLGAFASVNHLHLQLFMREESLSVERHDWSHNGGKKRYPVSCEVFEDSETSWECIAGLHQRNEAYNLLYTPGRLYCMPRSKQGDFILATWSNGFSWYELCGGMITFNRETYCELDSTRIEEDLQQVKLNEPF